MILKKKILKAKPINPNHKMKASEKEIITAFLGKTLNLPTDKVAQLFEKNGEEEELKSDSLDELLKHDAARVKIFKDQNAEHFLNGQKKATKEFGENRDKELKKKYEFDSDKIGDELVDEIIAAKTKPSTLTDDQVKIHPLFTKAEKEAAKKIKEAEDAAQAKIDAREKEIARNATLSKIKGLADAKLKELKPIFNTTDAAKIQNQIDKLLLSELNGYEYEIQGEDVIVMKDGKRLEDGHGKAISFDELVKTNASKNWEFEEGTGRQGAGADNDDAAKKLAAAKATKFTGVIPKSDAEFSEAFGKITDKKERVLLTEAYEGSKGKV